MPFDSTGFHPVPWQIGQSFFAISEPVADSKSVWAGRERKCSFSLYQRAAQGWKLDGELPALDGARAGLHLLPRDGLGDLGAQPHIGEAYGLRFLGPVGQDDPELSLRTLPRGVKNRRNFVSLAFAFPMDNLD